MSLSDYLAFEGTPRKGHNIFKVMKGKYLKLRILYPPRLFFRLTAALFTIATTWKPPKCSLTREWIKKMWYTHEVEYDTHKKEQNDAICSKKRCK